MLEGFYHYFLGGIGLYHWFILGTISVLAYLLLIRGSGIKSRCRKIRNIYNKGTLWDQEQLCSWCWLSKLILCLVCWIHIILWYWIFFIYEVMTRNRDILWLCILEMNKDKNKTNEAIYLLMVAFYQLILWLSLVQSFAICGSHIMHLW